MVEFLESHFISHLVLLFIKVNFIFWSLPKLILEPHTR